MHAILDIPDPSQIDCDSVLEPICQSYNRYGCAQNDNCGNCLPEFNGVAGPSIQKCTANSATPEMPITWKSLNPSGGDLQSTAKSVSFGLTQLGLYNAWKNINNSTVPPVVGKFSSGPVSAVMSGLVDMQHAVGFQFSPAAISSNVSITIGFSVVSPAFPYTCSAGISEGVLFDGTQNTALQIITARSVLQPYVPYKPSDIIQVLFNSMGSVEVRINGVSINTATAPPSPATVVISFVPFGQVTVPAVISLSDISYLAPCCRVDFVFFLDYDRLFSGDPQGIAQGQVDFKLSMVAMLTYQLWFPANAFPTLASISVDNITMRGVPIGSFSDLVTIATVTFQSQAIADSVQAILNKQFTLAIKYSGYRFFPVSIAAARDFTYLKPDLNGDKQFWTVFLCGALLAGFFMMFACYRPKNRKAWAYEKKKFVGVVSANHAFDNPMFESPTKDNNIADEIVAEATVPGRLAFEDDGEDEDSAYTEDQMEDIRKRRAMFSDL